MRVLLIHPEDSPERGPWTNQAWDLVIDLGKAGPNAYQRWTGLYRCPVKQLELPDAAVIRSVRDLLASGVGRLRDGLDLDWWELISINLHKEMEMMVQLRKLAMDLSGKDELFVSRPGFYGEALRVLGPVSPRYFEAASSVRKGVGHYLRVAQRFSLPQLVEIFWDKYDAAHRCRSYFSLRRKPGPQPVVLLPSAYGNVSRIELAYAATLPGSNFLLVATRRSGWVSAPPENVTIARLAAYVPSHPPPGDEFAQLMDGWRSLRRELESIPEIGALGRLGLLDSFPRMFRSGLGVRDAWREVFAREPIKAVLCGDDANPFTHIPLLLARKAGMPALACHHGALNGYLRMKQNHADVILAKGEMEGDYLVRICGVPAAEVEIGAPANPPAGSASGTSVSNIRESCNIVLFSEFYEVSGGRALEFYRELVPPLADLALETGRTLIVKLHPFELAAERERAVENCLSATQRKVTRVVTGPLTEELLTKTWFGITILSTVATECALHGIPCFLCAWLEFWPYGYIEQYGKFGAGRILKSAAEIARVPQMLEDYTVPPEIGSKLWNPIATSRLEELLTAGKKRDNAAAMCRN